MRELLRIKHIAVRKDRLAIDVELSSSDWLCTTPELIERVLEWYPHLLGHACVNEKGSTFGAVARRTSLPHLLEHMIIEEQVRMGDDPSVLYAGKTFWTDKARGMARIEVSYADDLIALRALRVASRRLNIAVIQ